MQLAAGIKLDLAIRRAAGGGAVRGGYLFRFGSPKPCAEGARGVSGGAYLLALEIERALATRPIRLCGVAVYAPTSNPAADF